MESIAKSTARKPVAKELEYALKKCDTHLDTHFFSIEMTCAGARWASASSTACGLRLRSGTECSVKTCAVTEWAELKSSLERSRHHVQMQTH
jgi:hypothetical protein